MTPATLRSHPIFRSAGHTSAFGLCGLTNRKSLTTGRLRWLVSTVRSDCVADGVSIMAGNTLIFRFPSS